MQNEPDGVTDVRKELDELRAEVRDLRDDLDEHLLTCPGSLQAVADG